MPEGRCDLILLGWTAFVGFNLMSDFLWGGSRAGGDASSDTGSGSPSAMGGGTSELYRGSYRLRSNGSDVEEGALRMSLGQQQTGIMAVQISSISMALRRAGTRSSMSSMEADIVFSGVEFGDVKKLVATGASDPKRLRYFGDRPCRLNAALELLPGDAKARSDVVAPEFADTTAGGGGRGGRGDADHRSTERPGSVIGEVTGVDCGLSMAFAVEAVDIVAMTQKVVHYSIWVNVLTIVQIRCYLLQMRHTEDGPSASRVSIACIGLQALMDAYDSFLHLCLGLSSQYMFNTIAVIALFKFVLFSLLEARYLLTIWRHRQPDIFNQGWETVRRELSWLYSRFYGVLVVGLVLLYHNLDRLDLIVLAFQAYWLPQIVSDAWQGCKSALSPTFCVGMSSTRLLFVLYLWGCPEGIFSDELYPRLPGSTSPSLCSWMVLMQAFQLGVMALQQRWGPRWFVPWVCMPWAYNYHSSPSVDPGTDCVICMAEIDEEEARRCVVTPCNHKFHQACLEQWMDVKMECPTCRTNLPPIQ